MSYVIGMRNKKSLVEDDKCSCGEVAIISKTVNGKRVHKCMNPKEPACRFSTVS